MSITLDNPDALLTPADVAEYRRTTVGALATERHRGTGPAYIRDGGHRVLYRAGDLAAYLDACRVVPGTKATALQRE